MKKISTKKMEVLSIGLLFLACAPVNSAAPGPNRPGQPAAAAEGESQGGGWWSQLVQLGGSALQALQTSNLTLGDASILRKVASGTTLTPEEEVRYKQMQKEAMGGAAGTAATILSPEKMQNVVQIVNRLLNESGIRDTLTLEDMEVFYTWWNGVELSEEQQAQLMGIKRRIPISVFMKIGIIFMEELSPVAGASSAALPAASGAPVVSVGDIVSVAGEVGDSYVVQIVDGAYATIKGKEKSRIVPVATLMIITKSEKVD